MNQVKFSGRISGKRTRISGRISKKTGYPAGRIAGATLVFISQGVVKEEETMNSIWRSTFKEFKDFGLPGAAGQYYCVSQKLPHICTVIAFFWIGKVAWFAVYICGNIWNAWFFVKKIKSSLAADELKKKTHKKITLQISNYFFSVNTYKNRN